MTTGEVVTTATAASPSAVTGDVVGRQMFTGQISSIDHAKGTFTLQTPQTGTLYLSAPPSSVANLKRGDTVMVELAAIPAR